MAMLADTARFHLDDPDELVAASLACPLCLWSASVTWALGGDEYDPSVACRCPRCEQSWSVYLTPDQALRLRLMAVRAG
ncbi:MAG: hypothetical protein ABSG43_03660 [Solirubrobacteraceae bacterium]|jgi:hypothetical protein